MKSGSTSTLFLKTVIGFVAVAAVAVWLVAVPQIFRQEAAKQPAETYYLMYWFLAYAFALSAPFFFALFQAFKLLTCIERDNAISAPSVGALRGLKYSALLISALMAGGIAGLMVLAAGKGEDLAGIVAPGLFVTLVAAAAAITAGVFQKRVQQALRGA